MAFFEELSKKAQNIAYIASEKAQVVAAAAGEKANAVADRAKAEYGIAAEKRAIDRNYRALGEWYVSEIGEDVPEAAADIVAAIRASQAKIAELEAVRPVKEAEEEAPKAEPELVFCPNCGAVVTSKFCPECGTQVK